MFLRKSFTRALTIAAMAAMCSGFASAPAFAAGSVHIANEWKDENLGPGVARWIDENGNVAEQPGVGPKTSSQNQTETPAETSAEQYPGQIAHDAEVVPDKPAEASAATEAAPAETAPAETAAEQTQSSGRNIDPSKPMIALTFDDGPYAPVGNQIMDCLAQYGGKATFFVVGNRCASYKTELRRMVAEGHEIGNHTQDHKYLNKLGASAIQAQINQGAASIQAASGVAPTLVRLPGGCKNATVLANVNYPMIMWSIDTEDWKTKNASKTIAAVVGKVKDGDIVLMHEIYKQSGAAAVEIIPALVNQGYQLVTVSELAQYRGGMNAGGVYYKFR